ncbi:MAG: VOC family protein [Hyphomicrobiaceae bacterium]
MNAASEKPHKSVVSALRYRELGAAVVWLCNAFGFKKHKIVANDNGQVLYAELSFGDSMVMLGSTSDQKVGQFLTQPDQVGGAETQTCYLVVDDVEALHERAKAAGAEFVSVIEHDENGGRSFGCRDLEGHIWFFGSYAPRKPAKQPNIKYRTPVWLTLSALVGLAGAIAAGGIYYHHTQEKLSEAERVAWAHRQAEEATRIRLEREQAALRQAKHKLLENRRDANQQADAAIERAKALLARERIARVDADRKVREAEQQIKQHKGTSSAVATELSHMREQLLQERAQRRAAEKRARLLLEKERAERMVADRKTKQALARLELQRQDQQARSASERTPSARPLVGGTSNSQSITVPLPTKGWEPAQSQTSQQVEAEPARTVKLQSTDDDRPLHSTSSIRTRPRIR